MTGGNGAGASAGTVVIFGGTGFVGTHLVRSFAAQGFRVRSASRHGECAPAGASGSGLVEPVRCDVLDRQGVENAVRGADIVIGSFMGDRRTQVEGTGNLCSALESCGAPRLLYLSTAEVYGNTAGRLDETAPLTPQGWEYSDSKIEAEALCQNAAKRGLNVTLFRPSIVYGPGAETWTIELGNKLWAGNWGVLAGFGDGICNLLYVDDLVDALHRSLAVASESGAVFNLNGPDSVTWNEFFARFNHELGLPPLRTWSRAEALLRMGVGQLPRGANALLRRLRGASPTTSSARLEVTPRNAELGKQQRVMEMLKATPRLRALTELYPRQVVYVDDKARKLLHYSPQVTASEGIARSAAWYKATRKKA